MDRSNDAANVLGESLEISPENPLTHFALGNVYAAMKDFQRFGTFRSFIRLPFVLEEIYLISRLPLQCYIISGYLINDLLCIILITKPAN